MNPYPLSVLAKFKQWVLRSVNNSGRNTQIFIKFGKCYALHPTHTAYLKQAANNLCCGRQKS
jgi:hypothetical protein